MRQDDFEILAAAKRRVLALTIKGSL